MRPFSPPAGPRRFLMLQGHPSAFWGQLADALTADGHKVVKVNLNLADQVFWGKRPALTYRGRFRNWPKWLLRTCQREEITDIIYYADQLPYHRAAQHLAGVLGLRAWVFEFGYLRPDWLTLERDGMGAVSRFPKDRSEIMRLAMRTPAPDLETRYTHSFATEAFGEVSYNTLASLGRALFPFYHVDKPHWPPLEYLSWLPLLMRQRGDHLNALDVTARLSRSHTRYNLVAMQMRDDYQIRASSPFDGLEDFLREVFASFLANAPADRHLIIKLHPLESGLPRWMSRIPRIARQFGIAGRVHVVRGGDLATLIRQSQGVVLVNSTVGLHALAAGKPVCTLGSAIYDIAGLTHKNGLDTFWRVPQPVDQAFFKTFRRALASIQIKGSFFDPAGRRAAIAEICARFAVDQSVTPALAFAANG